MYKVVLVDDEPFMIEGLLNMIDWNKYGFKVSGVANDGELALELIESLEPDLVITDIRMPGISGLDLIEKCQKEFKYKCQFVIISGYNEFDYIKKAINLKCVSYILKPIDQDEVHELLTKIQKKLMDESKSIEESIDVVIKMTLDRMITEPVKPSVISRAEFLLDWSQEKAYCYTCIYGHGDSTNEQINVFKAVAKEHDCRLVILGVENNTSSFLTYGNKEALNLWSMNTKMLIKEQKKQVTHCLTISPVSPHLSNLKDMVYLAKHNVTLGFYQASPLVESLDTRFSFSNDLNLFDKYKLLDILKDCDQEEINYEMLQIFRQIRLKLPEPEFLLVTLKNAIKHMEKLYETKYEYKEIIDFYEFKVVSQDMMAYFKKLELKCSKEIGIDHIKEYVDSHYHQDVRLKEVAKIFGYNSVYLGQLFLKTYAMKYKDYVLKVRVTKAKELLRYTNDSVKQVAHSVGFSNPDYFVSKFKSVVGMSPTRYRV